jgi:hypothetical protein
VKLLQVGGIALRTDGFRVSGDESFEAVGAAPHRYSKRGILPDRFMDWAKVTIEKMKDEK